MFWAIWISVTGLFILYLTADLICKKGSEVSRVQAGLIVWFFVAWLPLIIYKFIA